MAQEQKDDRRVGIHFSNFGRDVYEDILHIYDDVAFPRGSLTFEDRYVISWQRILEDLSLRGVSEWRYGSRFGSSKLMIRLKVNSVVSFEFNPNIARDNPNYNLADDAARDFDRKIKEYLIEKGLAEEII